MKELFRYIKNRSLKPQLETIFNGISNSRKKSLDNWFQDHWQKIHSFTKSLESISDDTKKTEELLLETVSQYNDFIEAFILDSKGTVIFSSYQPHINLSYASLPNYIKGMQKESYMYGPFCDKYTLDIPVSDKPFFDEVTLILSEPYQANDEMNVFCIRILNDDMSNVIQEEKSHFFKVSGDNYLFMIKNNRNIPAGTAISRSRFEDKTFTHGDNLKDGVRTKHWDTVKIQNHTEFEIIFTDPATKQLHQGLQKTIKNGENLDCWPGYPDYRHILVGGKGTVITPPNSDEIWGMMCEADISEMYRFNSLRITYPIVNTIMLILAFISHFAFSLFFEKYIVLCDILFIILMFILSYLLTKSFFTKPVESTLSILREITEGDGQLSYIEKINSVNEVGELVKWFNKFIHNQRRMIKRIGNALKLTKTTLKQVGAASNRIESEISDINDTINSLSENSKKQNNLFQHTQKEVKKISDSFEKNAELTELIADISQKTQLTSSASANAKNVTQDVEYSIEELEHSMQNALNSIVYLSNQSEQITNIVSTISNISKQTNLLSLNASIEAASAGEAGRGFAVVANEIKSLSNETQSATKTISDLVHCIQNEIIATNKNIGIINEKVQNSIKSTRESTKTVDLVIDVSKTMLQIINIMEEQNQVIQEVRQNISRMSEESTQSLSISEENTEIAEKRIHSITKQTFKLKKVLEGLTSSSKVLEQIVTAFTLEK